MSKKHLHLYKKINIGGFDKVTRKRRKIFVYACQKPDCHHSLRPEFLAGKIAECPRCHDPFIIPREQIADRMASPHCINCTQFKDTTIKKREKALELLKELGMEE